MRSSRSDPSAGSRGGERHRARSSRCRREPAREWRHGGPVRASARSPSSLRLLPGERGGEHDLVARRDQLQVADRDRRPAEHVERPEERRRAGSAPRARRSRPEARRSRARARRRDRPRADRSATSAPHREPSRPPPARPSAPPPASPRTFSPYSSARAGNVARCASAASWKKSGQVSAGGSGIAVSTTCAPSSSSRSTYASAAWLTRGRRAADGGRLRQQAHRQAGRAVVEGSARRRAPTTSSPRRRPSSPSARPCRSSGRAGRRRRSGPAPRRLQPDDAAARRGQTDRAACVGPDSEVAPARGERGRVAPRRATGRPPGQARILDGAVPGVLARDPPRELVQVGLADDDGPGRDQPLDRGRSARRERGRRRSSSRTSCGSPPCRSGP